MKLPEHHHGLITINRVLVRFNCKLDNGQVLIVFLKVALSKQLAEL